MRPHALAPGAPALGAVVLGAVVLGAVVLVGAVTTAVLAQPRPSPRPRPQHTTAATSAHGDAAVTADATAPGEHGEHGAGAQTDAGAETDAPWPMHQVGTGTVLHFPVPEQLARTELPVFVQIRSSAPIDHVALFFRAVGARRYTEVRMTAMGQQMHLPSGYGAQIPCDDVFPPRVEYYVQAIDQSGAPNGTAGTATAPIVMPIVEERHFPAPTLPGGAVPRTCGTLMAGTVSHTPGANAVPERGTADLGEPCHANNDCRRGLRCGSNHACVFESPR